MHSSRCGRRNGKPLLLSSPPFLPDQTPLPKTTNYLLTPFLFRSYNEMLFMIDTCQANTMYSRFYSPNIIATGSSAFAQSSYSHHADNDVGVAVIDRYTYYNLEFLETQVPDPNSKRTLGELFDSYDERQIHSQPGIRWDLFEGGEAHGRDRLVMDFFGNVQGVEIDNATGARTNNASEWTEDLRRLAEIRKKSRPATATQQQQQQRNNSSSHPMAMTRTASVIPPESPRHDFETRTGAAKVVASGKWAQQISGLAALASCALLWVITTWMQQGQQPTKASP